MLGLSQTTDWFSRLVCDTEHRALTPGRSSQKCFLEAKGWKKTQMEGAQNWSRQFCWYQDLYSLISCTPSLSLQTEEMLVASGPGQQAFPCGGTWVPPLPDVPRCCRAVLGGAERGWERSHSPGLLMLPCVLSPGCRLCGDRRLSPSDTRVGQSCLPWCPSPALGNESGAARHAGDGAAAAGSGLWHRDTSLLGNL